MMVRLFTDSTCDLPANLVQQYGIQVIPLHIIFGGQALRDGIDITNQDFFDRLRKANPLPTTSQPSIGEFQAYFEPVVNKGEEILAILISSKLSGTFASAVGAKENLGDAPITLVDSLSVSIGLGFQVLAAAQALQQGATRAQAAAEAERVRARLGVWFVLDTLEYLHKGGRIGGAQTLVGTLLNIKPVLTLQDGMVQPYERVRTKKRALERMVEVAVEWVGGKKASGLAVVHGDAEEEAKQVAEWLQARLQCDQFFFTQVTPVIGVHTGPGIVGVGAF